MAKRDDRAIVPFDLTRHIFSKRWTGARLRRRWFRAPPKPPKKPRPPKPTRRQWAIWTDTDDAVVLAFPPAEAAKMLGRSLASIYQRRCRKDLGGENGDRKPRKRLRREYFKSGRGPRAEVVPPQPRSVARLKSKCRYCLGIHHSHGLCRKCYDWVFRLVRKGYVTREMAEQCWLLPKR